MIVMLMYYMSLNREQSLLLLNRKMMDFCLGIKLRMRLQVELLLLNSMLAGEAMKMPLQSASLAF